MARFKLTKASIASLPRPTEGWRYHYDTEERGLALAIGPAISQKPQANQTFYLYRRIRGRPERLKLGAYPELTIERAREKAKSYNVEIADGKNPAEIARALREELTLRALFNKYVSDYALPRGKKSVLAMEDNFKRYLGDIGDAKRKPRGRARAKPKGSVNWEDRRLSQIAEAEVRRLHNAIGNHSGPYSANRVLQMLRALFNFAIRAGEFAGDNPAVGIELFDEAERERFIQPDELPAFFKSLAGELNQTIRNFFLLAILTGARRANALGMRWVDVNLERAEWCIPGTETKNSAPHTVPLVGEAVEALKSQLELVNAQAMKADCAPSPFVFPGTGATGHLASPKKAWTRILKRAGLTNLRIHDLRRSLGSWQARTGASLVVIGKTLAHKSSKSTAIYARLDLDPVRQSVQQATSAMLVAGGVKIAAPVSRMAHRRRVRK